MFKYDLENIWLTYVGKDVHFPMIAELMICDSWVTKHNEKWLFDISMYPFQYRRK